MPSPRPSSPSLGGLLVASLPAVPAFASLVGIATLRGAAPLPAVTAAAFLLLLPALGIASLLGRRPASLAVGLGLWSLAVFAGFPVYAPGERGIALADGAGVLVAPLGEPTTERVRTALLSLTDPPDRPPESVVEMEREEPPAVAALTAPEPAEESAEPQSGTIILPFEGDGRRLRVPVRLEGPKGVRDVWMLFDTGATFTTLDRATVHELGLPLGPDAPTVTLETAAGAVSSRLLLADRLFLDDTAVEGVTVALCEDCSTDRFVGLLGLNVTGRYQVSLDNDGGEIVLTPGPVEDRTVDIARWLALDGSARIPRRGPVQLEVVAQNLAARPILEAVAEVTCKGDSFAVQLDDVPARGERRSAIELPSGTDCRRFQVRLLHARW